MSDKLLPAVLAARRRGDRALLVTGAIGAGKTGAVLSLTCDLLVQGIPVGGVASPRVLAGGDTVGYRVRDLSTGEERPLCSLTPPGIPFRRFFFSPEALAFATEALARAARRAEVAVADEVGPLELAGGGFAPGLRTAVGAGRFLVLTVRPSLVDEVRRWVDLPTAPVVTVPALPTALRTLDGTRQLFDRAAAGYEPGEGNAGPLTGYPASLARAGELVRVGPGARLLDIGIGTGSFAAQVARSDTVVWGVDLSPGMLAQCREDHPGYHLREGHFLQLPVPDEAFDIVISSFAFHHLLPAEYERAFREILRALAPGGRFVLLDVLFASESDRQAARAALGDLWDDEEIYPLVPEVEAAARRAGAEGVGSQHVGELHWAVVGAKARCS